MDLKQGDSPDLVLSWAFSHIGVIASGVTLARALAANGGQASTEGASA